MPVEDIYQALNEVFRDVFDDTAITLARTTVAADVPGWDSMAHISLIVAAEAKFGIKFKTAEIEGMRNVGQFVDIISSRLRDK